MADPTPSPVGETAVAYASRGWHVVPLHWIEPGAEGPRCSCKAGAECGSPGKHPIMTGWQHRDKPEPAHVAKAYTERWPKANVGLATGRASGFWVLDVDPKNGGGEVLEAWVAEHGAFDTRTVRTPSGGWHFYFALPDFKITNARGELPAGIDVRGDGGQVAAPPSVGAVGSYQVAGAHPQPELLREAPAWLLELVRPKAGEGSSSQSTASNGLPPEGQYRTGPLEGYLARILEREVNEVLAATEGGRNHALNEATFTLATMIGLEGVPDDWEERVRWAMMDAGLRIGLNTLEAAKTIASGVDGGKNKPRLDWPPPDVMGAVAPEELPTPPEGNGIVARSQDDIGLGWRIADHFGQVIRWVPERDRWYCYEGGRWVADAEAARRYAHRMLDAAEAYEALLYAHPTAGAGADGGGDDGAEKKGPTERERFWKWIKGCRSSSKVTNALLEARSVPGMVARLEDFDRDPNLLNCPNGTLELDTGTLREHRPADLLTLMTAASWPAFGTETAAPSWTAFLETVMPDPDDREALWRAAGYSATGHVGEQVMFVHWGEGANGKSVFHDVLARVLGGYSQSTPRDTFAGHAGDRHPTDVARMVGKRHVTTIEPRTGRGLDEDLIKQLTGGDVMAARFMRQDFFEFRPVGKIHYITNHLPRVSDDAAVWRRVQVFGWTVVIPVDERVKGLADIIARDEGEAVLAWLVEGAARWKADGLLVTDAMRKQVETWRAEEDHVGAWLAERVVAAEGDAWIANVDLFGSWQGWCSARGLQPGSADALGRRLAERKFVRVRRNGNTVRGFGGIAWRVEAVGEAGAGTGAEFDG